MASIASCRQCLRRRRRRLRTYLATLFMPKLHELQRMADDLTEERRSQSAVGQPRHQPAALVGLMAINSPFRSSADLVAEALKNLGVLAAGQPVDPEDFAYVNERLDPIFASSAMLEIVYVADAEQHPRCLVSDLADIVAGECATKFGIHGEEYVTLVNKGLGGAMGVEIGAGSAAKSLKIMNRGRPTYEVQRILNY
jgi:hypothetical protein